MGNSPLHGLNWPFEGKIGINWMNKNGRKILPIFGALLLLTIAIAQFWVRIDDDGKKRGGP
jgi:hypothetical protein